MLGIYQLLVLSFTCGELASKHCLTMHSASGIYSSDIGRKIHAYQMPSNVEEWITTKRVFQGVFMDI